MRIITKKVGEGAVVAEVENLTLEAMQALVGGLIQPVYMDDIICWVNEEGKLFGLDVNVALTAGPFGKVIDTLHGDIFFTNEEEGNEGLNDIQVQSLLERLNDGTRTFARSDMHIVPILTI